MPTEQPKGPSRVPPRASARRRAPDRGMLVLEQKLAILVQGSARTYRNPALDVLTGRVPDARLESLQASLLQVRTPTTNSDQASTPGHSAPTNPAAMVLPVAAIRMAAVARARRLAPSPWLQPTAVDTHWRLRLVSPPPSRLLRLPWLGGFLVWLRAECRPYTSPARSPRPRPVS
jgi:hypothetical protein